MEIWFRADAYEARFSADEVFSWPEGREAALADAQVIRRVDNTESVVCDACHDGHVEDVVLVESPAGSPVRGYIHCPEAGRVAVPLERLKQWAVDFNGLAVAVARGLDLAGEVEEIIRGRLWSLGKTTIAARSRDVFLARGTTWIDAPDVFGGCDRVNASRGAVILVPGDMPTKETWTGERPSVVPLKLVACLQGKRVAIDRNHLEGLLAGNRRKPPVKAQHSFPTPPGTKWDEVMVWVTDFAITIEAKRRRREFSFEAAGFEEKRKRGVPDLIWGLLKAFAMCGGVIPFDGPTLDHNTRTNLKKYVSVLRGRLRDLIPDIDGDPIPHVKDEHCYRMSFKIASREHLTFPVPPGTQWPDVTVELLGPNAVRISVSNREQFAAVTYSEEADGDVRLREPAERESKLERDYDLRMLGLADDNGRPDTAGVALIEVIQAKGAVNRPQDDDAMLELCEVLTKLMAGIDGSAFDFAPGSQKWIALFHTSYETR
jgi:hypothetical protein